jgi:guanosine-diphosphatase
MKAGAMTQAQKTRWLKTGAIIFVVFFLFYYFSPSGVELYNGGEYLKPNSAPLKDS